MSEINSLLTSLGLSPENDSQLLTTSSFRRYTSNVKPTPSNPTTSNKPIEKKVAEAPPKSERVKRKQDPTVSRTKKRIKKADVIPTKVHDESSNSKTPVRTVARYCPKSYDTEHRLDCEWKDCSLVLHDMDSYLDHVDMHLLDDLKVNSSKLLNFFNFLLIKH